MDDQHRRTIEAMYGGTDEEYEHVRDLLGRSGDPQNADTLYDVVADLGIGPDHVVLDVGARDGRHSLELAARLGCRVIAVDPVADNVARGAALIAAHPQGHLVDLSVGAIEDLPAADWSIDCIFSRDMMSHVVDLDVALAECARVLRPEGAMVMYQTFAGPRLVHGEADELYRDLAVVPERMDGDAFEASVEALGLSIRSKVIIGSQWREAWEESGEGRTAQQLLEAARLLRLRETYVAELGEETYRIELANALWGVYQMIGKLEPRIYVLAAPACAIA